MMDISLFRFVRVFVWGLFLIIGVIEFIFVCEDLGKFFSFSDVVLLFVVSFIVLDLFVDKVVFEFCKFVVDFV